MFSRIPLARTAHTSFGWAPPSSAAAGPCRRTSRVRAGGSRDPLPAAARPCMMIRTACRSGRGSSVWARPIAASFSAGGAAAAACRSTSLAGVLVAGQERLRLGREEPEAVALQDAGLAGDYVCGGAAVTVDREVLDRDPGDLLRRSSADLRTVGEVPTAALESLIFEEL